MTLLKVPLVFWLQLWLVIVFILFCVVSGVCTRIGVGEGGGTFLLAILLGVINDPMTQLANWEQIITFTFTAFINVTIVQCIKNCDTCVFWAQWQSVNALSVWNRLHHEGCFHILPVLISELIRRNPGTCWAHPVILSSPSKKSVMLSELLFEPHKNVSDSSFPDGDQWERQKQQHEHQVTMSRSSPIRNGGISALFLVIGFIIAAWPLSHGVSVRDEHVPPGEWSRASVQDFPAKATGRKAWSGTLCDHHNGHSVATISTNLICLRGSAEIPQEFLWWVAAPGAGEEAEWMCEHVSKWLKESAGVNECMRVRTSIHECCVYMGVNECVLNWMIAYRPALFQWHS